MRKYSGSVRDRTKVIHIESLPQRQRDSGQEEIAWRALLDPDGKGPFKLSELRWTTMGDAVADTAIFKLFHATNTRIKKGIRTGGPTRMFGVHFLLDIFKETSERNYHHTYRTKKLIFVDVMPPVDEADVPRDCPKLGLDRCLEVVEFELKKGATLTDWTDAWDRLWRAMESRQWSDWDKSWRERWDRVLVVRETGTEVGTRDGVEDEFRHPDGDSEGSVKRGTEVAKKTWWSTTRRDVRAEW